MQGSGWSVGGGGRAGRQAAEEPVHEDRTKVRSAAHGRPESHVWCFQQRGTLQQGVGWLGWQSRQGMLMPAGRCSAVHALLWQPSQHPFVVGVHYC